MFNKSTAEPTRISIQAARSLPAAIGGLVALAALPGSSLGQNEPAASAPAEYVPPIVPVHDEPHHRQLFQFGPTRILELQVPPGDGSWFHTHEWPVLYMTLSQARTRTTNFGADANAGGRGGAATGGRGGPAPAGRGGAAPGGRGAAAPGGRGGRGGQAAAGAPRGPRASGTTSYIDNPVTHRIDNIGDTLFRAMVVINETLGNDTVAPADAGFDAEPEYSNAWFRAYRVTLNPSESTSTHTHNAPVVLFQATDGTGIATGPMNFEFNEPGQWAFYDTGLAHTLENTGNEAIELLEVEVRLP